MRISLHWRRPLFYLLLPVLLVMAFVGFPPPLAPPRGSRPPQEQSEPANESQRRGGRRS